MKIYIAIIQEGKLISEPFRPFVQKIPFSTKKKRDNFIKEWEEWFDIDSERFKKQSGGFYVCESTNRYYKIDKSDTVLDKCKMSDYGRMSWFEFTL